MKQLFTLFSLILLSCNMNDTKTNEIKKLLDKNANKIDTIKQDPNEFDAIKKMLTAQQECWNNWDIEGFMEGYWNSEELIFTSAKHKPTYGWQNTLERYRESYPDKQSMGEFRFEILDLKLNSEKTASLRGKWELIRINDYPNGLFWLDLEKFDKNWLITKDSTMSFEINTTS